MCGLICCYRRICVWCFGSVALWMGQRGSQQNKPGEQPHIPALSPGNLVHLQAQCTGWFLISLSLPCYLLSILCHAPLLLFFPPSFSFLLHPLCCFPTIASLVLSRFTTCSLISYCFSPVWALPFSTSAPQNVSMSSEKQKRNKEIYVTRDTKNTPTVAQVSGLVHIIICLLCPVIFPSCHLCFMVKTNF